MKPGNKKPFRIFEFWEWLREEHPVIDWYYWAVITSLSIASIIISLIVLMHV